MRTYTVSVVLCLVLYFRRVYTRVNEAECLTADGSGGRCLVPSECPPSYSRQKPVLCRYSRVHGVRICCSRSSLSIEREDFYSNDEPIAFPSEFGGKPLHHSRLRPSTSSYNNPFFGKGTSYRPSTNSFERPAHEEGYNKPSYNSRPNYNERPGSGFSGERDYDERPSYNNRPNYERPEVVRPSFSSRPNYDRPSYESSSFDSSFGRPDNNGRPELGAPSYNNRPNYGASSSKPPFSRPIYDERPEVERPSYNSRPSYEKPNCGTTSSESSFDRPDYNQRPEVERPSYNKQPNYGSSSSEPSFGRPNYNQQRPEVGRPSYSVRPNNGRPKPDVWGSAEDSSEEISNGRRTTARPSWTLEDNNEPSASNRRISDRKCEEYSQPVTETLNPLPLSLDSASAPLKVQKCDLSAVKLIVGGDATELGEFPHMAAIGFGLSRSQDVSWNCGGTLISDQYVMTAAHCVNTTFGRPKVVRLGEYNLERDDDGADPEDYGIEKIVIHPEYTKTRKYNDIALVRLSRRVDFNKRIRPACLYTENRVQGNPTATGWGRTHFVGKLSEILMKVNLNVVETQQCNSLYRNGPGAASFSSGIIDTMICAGEMQGGRDTCLGDSGGPLSVTKADNPCVHYVVGVTSFGKICGAPRSPGVYTRVSKYLPWIERTVWSDSE